VLLDRFCGGGATALSGGVVYTGGGTAQQRAAGVSDTPDAMVSYLSTEVGDAVAPATLRAYCQGSSALLAWLESLGVPFEGSLCPDKTSYPANQHYLYYSGSELSAWRAAPPAPRGHRVRGRGTSGGLLFARLAAAVRRSGAQVLMQTRAERLVTDAAGQVTGVQCQTLSGAPGWARLAHRELRRWSAKPGLYAPTLGRALHRPVAGLERRYARPLAVGARRGVVLAAADSWPTGPCSASTHPRSVVGCRWARQATTAAGSGSAWRRAGRPGSWTGCRCGGSSAPVRSAGRGAGGPGRRAGGR
jgi:3-oxo-5alpha-steroid 4-dehydrogenase